MHTTEHTGPKSVVERIEETSINHEDMKAEPIVGDHTDDLLDGVLLKSVLRKVDMTLMPCICWLVIVAYLDRSAIGNAKIAGMTDELNMSGTDYSIVLFIFFIPYILLDVPANMLMKKSRPSQWLCGLMLAWSFATIGEGVTQSYVGLVVCRLILGLCETGFFPGAVYLMACYYTRRSLLKRICLFYAASILANAFGGLLAYAISHMDGVAGYSGWRWIFILEGVLTAITAGVFIWFTPDWPEQARFLTPNEKQAYLASLASDESDLVEGGSSITLIKRALLDPKLWFAALISFTGSMAANSSGFFLPTILYELGWTDLKAQYLSVPVYLVAAIVTVANGALSDHFKHRYAFVMFPLVLLLIGYSIFLAQSSVNVGVRYMASFFMVSGAFSVITIAVGWLSNNVPGRRRKGITLAVQLGVGNCGGILGANIFLQRQSPTYTIGYGVCVAMVLASMCSATMLFIYLWTNNEAKRAKRQNGVLANLNATEQVELGEKHPAFVYIY